MIWRIVRILAMAFVILAAAMICLVVGNPENRNALGISFEERLSFSGPAVAPTQAFWSGPVTEQLTTRYSLGLPFRCMFYETQRTTTSHWNDMGPLSQGTPVWSTDACNIAWGRRTIAFPTHVLWAPLLANVAVILLIVAASDTAIRTTIRWRRVVSGRCVQCGYDQVNQLPRCPECGLAPKTALA